MFFGARSDSELKAAQAQKSELSRDQLREFLVEVILTPAGKVNEQSRLCQSYKVTPEVREIRIPQLTAMMSDWTAPQKVNVGADAELVELMWLLTSRSAAL